MPVKKCIVGMWNHKMGLVCVRTIALIGQKSHETSTPVVFYLCSSSKRFNVGSFSKMILYSRASGINSKTKVVVVSHQMTPTSVYSYYLRCSLLWFELIKLSGAFDWRDSGCSEASVGQWRSVKVNDSDVSDFIDEVLRATFPTLKNDLIQEWAWENAVLFDSTTKM